ncbi:MAG: DUF1254 domain-containing protein [Hyphomonadaceae bacterium]
MDRRLFLAGAAGVGLAASLGLPAFALPPMQPLDLEDAAAEAWIYGVMLIENAQSRSNTAPVPPNTLIHAYELTTVKTQWVTTPNNDTLYSRAWIDLNGGPVTLEMPASGDRYVSYAFMDMYGTNFAILGSRTTGNEARKVTLVGPLDKTSDKLAIRSPTPWVWLLIRTLIDGEGDRPVANALQNRMKLTAPKRPAPKDFAKRDAAWDTYFASVQALLIENPPPAEDMAFFQRVKKLGLGAAGGFDAKRFSAADIAKIETGIAKGRAAVIGKRSGNVRGGWMYPRSNLGDFKQDYLFRAQVAVGGLAALTLVEATYLRPVYSDGGFLWPSDRPWMLRFEKDNLPPVDAFWSLTAYERTDTGAFYFFDNPISRYAIGDRTPGLKYGADGSLEIYIQRNDPGGAKSSNWLPSPPAKPLALNMRFYLPKSPVLDGTYTMPAIVAG